MQNFYIKRDDWLNEILADPISKEKIKPNFDEDFRVHLKNTYGYEEWISGQKKL
jgi:hypothetical protein